MNLSPQQLADGKTFLANPLIDPTSAVAIVRGILDKLAKSPEFQTSIDFRLDVKDNARQPHRKCIICLQGICLKPPASDCK